MSPAGNRTKHSFECRGQPLHPHWKIMAFYNYPTRMVNEIKQDGQINELTLVDYQGRSYIVASAHYAYLGANCGGYTELRIYRDEDDYCPSIGQEWINKPEDAF